MDFGGEEMPGGEPPLYPNLIAWLFFALLTFGLLAVLRFAFPILFFAIFTPFVQASLLILAGIVGFIFAVVYRARHYRE